MKILLIGFSKQSADVLNALVRQYYPEHQCVSIERDFNNLLRLSLPSMVNTEHPDAQILVLNLDGVGMMTYMPNRIKQLQEFIKLRAVLFIAKTDLVLWRQANIIPKEFAHFLKSPHTKQDIILALGAVIKSAPYLKDNAHHFAPIITTETIINETINPYRPTTAQDPNQMSEFVRQVVERYFQITKGTILYDLLSMSFYNTPIKVVAGRQTFYLNKAQNLALVQNLDRLLDYLLIAKNYTTLNHIISVHLITYEEFDEVIRIATHQRQSLNTLLWQLYDKVLPEKLDVTDKNLLLKIKYMPNFGLMSGVPQHTHSLISSCLVTPKKISELQESLGQLGKAEDIGMLNRVFLLAVVSGVADLEILKSSTLNNFGPKINVQRNEGVTKASSTGFFKRLLQKLHISK